MLNPRVTEVVKDAAARKQVTLVMTIHPRNMAAIASITDVDKRITKLKDIYRRKKRPVVRDLAAYEKAGLRVNRMAGAPNLIVTAPAGVWRKVMLKHPGLFDDPDIAFSTNERTYFPQLDRVHA